MKHCVMLSYPRSGNTFTRYMFECITGVSTEQTKYHKDKHIVNRKLLQTSKTSKLISLVKCHNSPNESNNILLSGKFDSLIFLVRSPIESFARHNGYARFNSKKTIDNFLKNENYTYYFDNCNMFVASTKPKLLLYYEDIILDCESYYRKLYEFCEAQNYIVDKVNSIKPEDFIKDLQEHKKRCLKVYTSSKSKGNAVDYHTAKIEKENVNYFMNEITLNHPDLFNTILSRYDIRKKVN